MKRIWFQFVRKELESDKPERTAVQETQVSPVAQTVNSVRPQPATTQESRLDVRLSGDLWIFPEGTYLPIVMTTSLEGLDHAGKMRLGAGALHLEVGETRQVSITLTRLGTERFDTMEFDRPLVAQVRTFSALAELQVGALIPNVAPWASDEVEAAPEAYAWGTAVLRHAVIKGSLYNEAFRIRLIELDQMRLLRDEQAWMGHLFQAIPDQVRSGAGRNLFRYLQAASTASDVLTLLRRAAERVGRSGVQRGTDDSSEERDDKAGQKVESGQDN